MSFLAPREKLFEIMESLDYVAVKDAFDFEDVGNSKLAKAFHLEQGTVVADEHGQDYVQVTNPQTIRYYNKGRRNTNETMDEALRDLNTILNTAMDIQNRTDADGIINVMMDSFSAVPHTDDNNDIVRGELVLEYTQVFCFQESSS